MQPTGKSIRALNTILALALPVSGVTGHASIARAQSAGTFTATGEMTRARFGHTATLLPNGKVLIAGGSPWGPTALFLANAELYDPSTGTFARTGNMTTARRSHTATLLPNGRVLIAGGASAYDYLKNFHAVVGRTEVYDPSTRAFTAAGDMTAARYGHTATLLANGKVLIAGGCDPGGFLGGALATAELYDPTTSSFAPTGNMTTGRCRHKATLLPSGKVLIVPGWEGEDYESAELYDPGAGAFSPADWQGKGDVASTANVLTSGKVLVTLNAQESAQLYNSLTELFASTGDMVFGTCIPTGTVLSDGTVLIVGGWGAGPRAQLYDPAPGVFSRAADMITGRYSHTATLLTNGQVLLAGGFNSASQPTDASLLASAELYNPPSSKPTPMLFFLPGDGQGQGAILQAGTARVVSARDPGVAGDALEIYCTGLLDGSVIPPQVAIGGRMAEVLWFGKAPGYASLNQVNVRVPSGVTPGPAVPVRLMYLARPSNEVSIGVK